MGKIKMIEKALMGMDKLPTIPGIAVKILEVVRNENSDLNEIADIISSDPPLSAEVLKTINSPLFGLSSKVTTVPRAVSMLGIDVVKNLALSFSLIKTNRTGDNSLFNFSDFWKNSLIGAISSKLIAKNLCPDVAEDAFFLGLLHNIGILTIVQCKPKQYSLVLQENPQSHSDYHQAESQILGFNHMEVGDFLTRKWGFPEIFTIPIRFHHYPEQLEGRHDNRIELFTKILHMASAFIDFFSTPDKTLSLGLIDFHIKAHGFCDKLKPEEILLQVQKQTADVFPLFKVKMGKKTDYSKIIEDARNELINVSSDILYRFVEQQKQIERLRMLATHDGLTGLINHQKFNEILEIELGRAKRYNTPVSLIFADIDHFKNVNDTYGHLAGDHALKVISKFLDDQVRTSDIVARYGGEEFGIILPETPTEGAVTAIERLRDGLSGLQIEYEGHTLSNISLSFGVASFSPGENISKNDFLKQADEAMYRAKRNGRNKCCIFVVKQ